MRLRGRSSEHSAEADLSIRWLVEAPPNIERTSRAKYLRKHDRDDVARRMPANLLESARASATAGLTKDMEAANQ